MATELAIQADDASFKRAMNTLAMMTLKPSKRRLVLRRTNRAIMRKARENVQQGRDTQGRPFKARANKEKKRRLLRKITKGMKETATDSEGRVYFSKDSTGRIAKWQQEGMTQQQSAATYHAALAKNSNDATHHYDAPATRKQAKRLIAAGFTIGRKGGKGGKKPSITWVTSNLTQGQFGAIYRELTQTKPKRSWRNELPARPFLGMPEREVQELLAAEIRKEQRK